jgi:hypothetical protein
MEFFLENVTDMYNDIWEEGDYDMCYCHRRKRIVVLLNSPKSPRL